LYLIYILFTVLIYEKKVKRINSKHNLNERSLDNLIPGVWMQSPIPMQSMFASVSNSNINISRHCALLRPRVLTLGFCSLLLRFGASTPMTMSATTRSFPMLMPIPGCFSSLLHLPTTSSISFLFSLFGMPLFKL